MAKKKPAHSVGIKPGVYVGKHPDTGVVHRLTINTSLKITIERQPYISPLDGWTKVYDDLFCEASKHVFLILKIQQNPCDWE